MWWYIKLFAILWITLSFVFAQFVTKEEAEAKGLSEGTLWAARSLMFSASITVFVWLFRTM